tara:strand:+ start:233 stop:367 length:135 start_codon:yes stop_codon:yes gene_type:complete
MIEECVARKEGKTTNRNKSKNTQNEATSKAEKIKISNEQNSNRK